MSDDSRQKRAVFVAIIAGVACWGLFHALGAYLFNHDPRRALVVVLCVFGFLGGWGWLLAVRRRQDANRPHDLPNRPSIPKPKSQYDLRDSP